MNEKGALNLPLMAAGLGILPKTVIEQALAKQYLNPTYSPKMSPRDADVPEEIAARAAHLGNKFVPIFLRQVEDQKQ